MPKIELNAATLLSEEKNWMGLNLSNWPQSYDNGFFLVYIHVYNKTS